MSVFNDYLLMGNVWDVASALSHKKAGFKAIGTSSAAVAASLGYEDGEDMPFVDLLAVVKAICNKVKLPLNVDIEAGYSRDIDEVANHVNALSKLGVAGINIEDSVVEQGARRILPYAEFADFLGELKQKIDPEIFVNARADVFIMGLENPLEQALERAKQYELAGANGVFVPCITEINDIKRVVNSIKIPLNVMCMPDLPHFTDLEEIGVKRISMGPFAFNMMVEHLQNKLEMVQKQQNFGAIFTG